MYDEKSVTWTGRNIPRAVMQGMELVLKLPFKASTHISVVTSQHIRDSSFGIAFTPMRQGSLVYFHS